MVSNWQRNIIDQGMIGYGASAIARLPTILFGQFYLTNKLFDNGTDLYATAVRPPPPGVFGPYTEISLVIVRGRHFPYGFTVEPP